MLLPEISRLCVDGFPLSARREPLMRSLQALCTTLSLSLIPAEVWVDGSFLTQKIDPDDIDLVVVVHSNILPGTNEQQAVLSRIAGQEFTNPARCDSYLHFEYPEGHMHAAVSELMRAYWIRQFCFSRNQEMKGLAVIRTPIA